MRSIITIHRKFAYMIAMLMCLVTPAIAQPDPPIQNEYRFTQFVIKPINEKFVAFTYTGITNSPEKHLTSYYGSPPNVVYIPKPWIEIYAAFIFVYTDNKRANDSWEFRPITGVKFYLPNKKKLNIYSWTRFEERFIVQDDEWQKIPRLRNRFGIEAPLAKGDKAWTPKTFYVLADIEPIWRLDQKRLQVLRLRGGIGYILNKTYRAELQYFNELSTIEPRPFDHTGNIFRLNIKILLPRLGMRYPQDVDID